MSGIHSGHRDRLRQRFVKEGLDGFAQHEVLELLLYNVIPFKDTNALAHELINKYGSLSGVLEAPYDELRRFDGLSDVSAANLALLYPLFNYYRKERITGQKLLTVKAIHAYAVYLLEDAVYEYLYVIGLDAKGKVIGRRGFCDNSTTSVYVSPRQIVETAFSMNSNNIVLVHSHPKGFVNPSPQDYEFTKTVYSALRTLNISLLEHIIVSGTNYFSFYEQNYLSKLYSEYNATYHIVSAKQEELKITDE
ncbi:MAG TPA: JAB domain-containing protein [Clostridia bacterium]|nr:JAB domain-containing protein [Clostridia bacterium]